MAGETHGRVPVYTALQPHHETTTRTLTVVVVVVGEGEGGGLRGGFRVCEAPS